MDKFLTVDEAAELLGVHRRTLMRRIEEGALTAYGVGPRLIRIKTSDALKLLSKKNAPAVERWERKESYEQLKRIAEHLARSGGIHPSQADHVRDILTGEVA